MSWAPSFRSIRLRKKRGMYWALPIPILSSNIFYNIICYNLNYWDIGILMTVREIKGYQYSVNMTALGRTGAVSLG
jgi:hypothetical protein